MRINSTADSCCVLVFLKFPQNGAVKTRLSRSLDADIVLNLYKNFVTDILAMLARTGMTVIPCHHPPDAGDAVQEWLGSSYRLYPQAGDNLGEKMAGAFHRAFADGFRRVLLMGTDVPDLPETVIRDGFKGLETRPAVIGPSEDGGYYLAGFNHDTFEPAVFENMPWSTPFVLARTLDILENTGKPPLLLPHWQDIDRPDDLEAFVRRGNKKDAPATFAYLSAIGMA